MARRAAAHGRLRGWPLATRYTAGCGLPQLLGPDGLALKAGEWFRRGRLLMVSPVHGDYRRCQAEISTYRPVQIPVTGSGRVLVTHFWEEPEPLMLQLVHCVTILHFDVESGWKASSAGMVSFTL